MISKRRRETAQRCGSHCGGLCMFRSIRRRMCLKTRLACGWSPRKMIGAAVQTWIRSSPAASEHQSWPALASSRTSSLKKLAVASSNTSSLAPAWTPSPSAGRRSPPPCGYSRSTGLVLRPGNWKRQRLIELGFGIPEWLRLVPVDFEAGDTWWQRLSAAGFDAGQPSVVTSTGVSMYLTKDAITATLRQVAALASGSTLAMSFLLPLELADPEDRPGLQLA